MNNPRHLQKLLVICAFLLIPSKEANSIEYSISQGYQAKYSDNFRHFDYVDPNAKQGGTIRLSAFGTYESLNPFLLKSLAPAGINTLVFETLMVRSLDEPSSSYGHIASGYDLANDGLSVTYFIKENARFSNGEQITADDVKFSFQTLMSNVSHPQYRLYWADIKSTKVLNSKSIKFIFKRVNPELHMIIGDLPVFSEKWLNGKSFEDTILSQPIASGPYTIDSYEPGKFIKYKKNKNYWAATEPTRKGMFNFDYIIYKYYKDMTVGLEAFKAGEYDYIFENHSKRWARDYSGPNFSNGIISKTLLKHENNAGIQGFIFNTRKEIFQNKKVRKAITLAFDFEWSNKNLFYNQYQRCTSYFSNSELSANNSPTIDEINMAESLGIPSNKIVNKDLTFMSRSTNSRANLIKAKKIFDDLGWKVRENVLYNTNGTPVEFDFLLAQKGFERILAPFAKNLKKLGIQLNYRTIDVSLYQRRVDTFDFDMMVMSYPQSQSPGNELFAMFHSDSAERRGSYNVGGIVNSDVDKLVNKIVYSDNRQEMITASHLLDRILWNEFYLLPNWYINEHRVAFFDKFKMPDKLPKYYQPTDYVLKTWYFE
tara:strand:+ start:9814 stop:11604 length:1791 start_codon:yes stop_codon:yes gene_type:complete